jgi:hypothetical protein
MKEYEDYLQSVDDTCWINCECGELHIFVTGSDISRCPKCGRGYRVEFKVWEFEKDES